MGGVQWTQKPQRPKLPSSREKMIELGVEALPFSTAAFIKVPTGSPSRGGDVAVYVFDMNQPSLPTPFWSALVSVSVLMALSTVFHTIYSSDNSPLSHSVLPVLFLPYWSFQLHISLRNSPSAPIKSFVVDWAKITK